MNLVLSSAGRRGALLRILQQTLVDLDVGGSVIAADMSRLTAAGVMADRFVQVSACTSPAFVPEMIEVCRTREAGLLVPTIDTELPAYAQHRAAFEEVGTTVLISDPATVAITADKRLTHQFLVSEGFPTVEQAPPEEVLENLGNWEFPLVVKPWAGSASVGVIVVTGEAQLRRAAAGNVIVQELAPGIEHTVDVWVDREGKSRCAVPRRRLEVRAGEVSKGVTVRNAALERLCRQIGEALPGAYGALTIQTFVDVDDVKVIEINARFGGGYPLSWQAGARFPHWAVEEKLGLPSTASDDWTEGLVMLRYDEAAYVEAAQVGL